MTKRMIRPSLPHRAIRTIVLTVSLATIGPVPLRAQEAVPSCESDPAFAWLDFWLGNWDVLVRGEPVGKNRIQKILEGCAIQEEWADALGRRGHSLFYFQPATHTWKQVWVTDRARARGGVKEKELIGRYADGGVRFQGEIPLEDGGSYLDRTTLTPVTRDEVRQIIEISMDGGGSWQITFDGLYVRRR